MRFIVSYGKGNTFSLDVKPMTNQEYVDLLAQRKKTVNDVDLQRSRHDPHGECYNGTMLRVKELNPGAEVAFDNRSREEKNEKSLEKTIATVPDNWDEHNAA